MHAIPPGEQHKSRAEKERIEDALAASRCGRDTVILALGGGVVTDLAGFVAATWHRGIPWIALPTTLLGMLDASIGGKTGVDHPQGKNLIGAFHQPAAVFADTAWLDTLPAGHLRSGLAEAIKAAVVRDAGLLEDLRARREAILAGDDDALADTVARCCAIKAQVVAADPAEGDLRQILNFGHTIGHAIEALSGFTMLHGDAVAIGMVAETRIAARHVGLSAGAAQAIEDLIAAFGLPGALREALRAAGAGAILEAARSDKKARAGALRYALPLSPGEMARCPEGYGIPVPDAVALQVLERMA
jgi:3-dehydroquinate synthase